MTLQKKTIIQSTYESIIYFVKGLRSLVVRISGIKRKGFIDYNNIGMNTREAILFRDADVCTMKKTKGKIYIEGSWTCRYSGKIIKKTSDLDIDHVVPLHYAKNHKIGIWTSSSFQAFENDTDNLISVEKSLNRSKGSKSIIDWKPPKGQGWYHSKWKKICDKWNLEKP